MVIFSFSPFALLFLHVANCSSTLRPERAFRWSTNNSDIATWGRSGSAQPTGIYLAANSTVSCSLTTGSPQSLETHYVQVGSAGELIFEPSEVDARVGDNILFEFFALNHTLTQSSLSLPCTNIGGFSTGFNRFNPQNVSGKFILNYRVKSLDPEWFFCAQTIGKSHCRSGMVFGLNAGQQMGAFASAATLLETSTLASGVQATESGPFSDTVSQTSSPVDLITTSSTTPIPITSAPSAFTAAYSPSTLEPGNTSVSSLSSSSNTSTVIPGLLSSSGGTKHNILEASLALVAIWTVAYGF
ncbi:hypothetical protein G7Y89_g3544 [Cudoniella acicularis]|uniref:Uncharacterized protein n=1 Tax=Cudoniella acicularis TaxID=354080 RepID=A0A8H4W8A6_9HELO|nr:hypothetical protein G7Y89_g3544 [Cudoniella acicularis]